MSLKESYQDVLDVAAKVGVTLSDIKEDAGRLIITSSSKFALERDKMWDQIKTHANWANEIMVLHTVTDQTIYGIHKVVSGETLGKIAKHIYGEAKHYLQIFEANKDQLHNPDVIKVGQELKLPNKPA